MSRRALAPALAASVAAWPTRSAWAQVAPAPEGWFVYGVIGIVLIGALIALLMIRAAIYGTAWSLSDALSEPHEVTCTTVGAAGHPEPRLDPAGRPVLIVEMRASTSRLIALMGMIAILLMFLGFGAFALHRFATTGRMPEDMDDAINFLVAGMTLFAPYAVNKFSELFKNLAPRR
ncbi:MAG: hypothetical protein AB7F67_17850 [Rhodospirillaceae bacterium]